MFIRLLIGSSLLFLSGCCFPFGCSDPKVWVSEEEDLVLSAAEVQAMDTETYNGGITYTAVEGAPEFKVHIEKKAGGKTDLDAKAAMAEIRIVTDASGGIQQLKSRWIDPDRARDNRWQARVSFTITGPADLQLQAKTYNGTLDATGIKGDVELVTYNGSIRMTRHAGKLRLETYNGNIDVESTCPDLDVETYNGDTRVILGDSPTLKGSAKSYNGSIQLMLKGEPSTTITASTTNGQIATDKPMKIESLSRSRVEAVLGEGKDHLNLKTYNGNIVIQ
jgi:DUF4097 and DUF4098 domain-containing protein YvlB